jgi:hypothetical protein
MKGMCGLGFDKLSNHKKNLHRNIIKMGTLVKCLGWTAQGHLRKRENSRQLWSFSLSQGNIWFVEHSRSERIMDLSAIIEVLIYSRIIIYQRNNITKEVTKNIK